MTTRHFQVTDLFEFEMLSDPQISPNGEIIAWVKTWIDPNENRYRSRIYCTERDTGATYEVSSQHRDTYPRWSPCGRYLAHLGQGPSLDIDSQETVIGQGPQLYVIELSSGDMIQVTDLLGGVSEFSWSPDGCRFAFTTFVHPEWGLQYTADYEIPVDLRGKFTTDVLRVSRLRYKDDGLGYIGDYFRQVALVEFDPHPQALQEVTLLTRGLCDMKSPSWAPSGDYLVALGNRDRGGERERRQYVYRIETSQEDGEQPSTIVGLEEMRGDHLTWSKDGQHLFVCGHDDPVLGHYGNQRVWQVRVADGSAQCLTEDLDLSFGNASRDGDIRDYLGSDQPVWRNTTNDLLLLGNHQENTNLYRLSLDGALESLTDCEGAVTAFSVDDSGRWIAALIADKANPGDLYLFDSHESSPLQPKQLTHLNFDLLDEIEYHPAQPFDFQSEGITMRGWLVEPVQAPERNGYPVLIYNGGGPGGMRTGLFCFQSQYLAAQGYAVLHANVRGNLGRGEAFSSAIRGRWGEEDYRDTLQALDEALRHFDHLDGERIGTFGGSYGGYMTNWIISRHPEMKAAVSINCLYNRLSDFGTGDMSFLLEKVEFEGVLPWENPKLFWERSPMKDVGRIQTPTLVIHAGRDHRCPVDQGEQLYFALRFREIPTELIRIAEASHGIRKPWHRIYRLEAMADWFERWF